MSTGLHSDLTGQHLTTPHRYSSHWRRLLLRWLGVLLGSFCCTHYAMAQGQDSSKWARDQQVIEVMLAGLYVNANQTYFDGRLKVDNPQSRANVEIRAGDATNEFSVTYKNKTANTTIEQQWALISDDEAGAVRMEITNTEGTSLCPLYWHREAAQFRAILGDECDNKGTGPSELVLSSQQLWWMTDSSEAPYELHRAREFTCYADVPGVGGGRDEPYNRYDNLQKSMTRAQTPGSKPRRADAWVSACLPSTGRSTTTMGFSPATHWWSTYSSSSRTGVSKSTGIRLPSPMSSVSEST